MLLQNPFYWNSFILSILWIVIAYSLQYFRLIQFEGEVALGLNLSKMGELKEWLWCSAPFIKSMSQILFIFMPFKYKKTSLKYILWIIILVFLFTKVSGVWVTIDQPLLLSLSLELFHLINSCSSPLHYFILS